MEMLIRSTLRRQLTSWFSSSGFYPRNNVSQGLRTLFLLLLSIALLLWLIDLFRAPTAPEGFAQQSLHTIDGRKLTIAELSARKPLLIYFWASGCSVCTYTTSNLIAMSDSGYNVLAIAQHSGNDIQIVRLLRGKHLTMPVVNDPAGEIATKWRISVVPTLLIVTKGRVVQSTTGWTSTTGMQLRLWWVKKWY